VKALSLRQPWAHVVLYHGKNIENRHWTTRFRGTFLLHASKGMTRAEYGDAEEFCAGVLGWALRERMAFQTEIQRDARFGGIVGIAKLVDVVPPCERQCFEHDEERLCSHRLWHMPEQFGFVLEHVVPLPFVPFKGSLGFFDVPKDVMVGAGL
jgi:hypothetical protein